MRAENAERTGLLAVDVPRMLRDARKRSGLTLKGMADCMRTTPQTIQRLETGSMTLHLEWLDKFLAVLNMTSDELFITQERTQAFADANRQIRSCVATELRNAAENLEKGNT